MNNVLPKSIGRGTFYIPTMHGHYMCTYVGNEWRVETPGMVTVNINYVGNIKDKRVQAQMVVQQVIKG